MVETENGITEYLFGLNLYSSQWFSGSELLWWLFFEKTVDVVSIVLQMFKIRT